MVSMGNSSPVERLSIVAQRLFQPKSIDPSEIRRRQRWRRVLWRVLSIFLITANELIQIRIDSCNWRTRRGAKDCTLDLSPLSSSRAQHTSFIVETLIAEQKEHKIARIRTRSRIIVHNTRQLVAPCVGRPPSLIPPALLCFSGGIVCRYVRTYLSYGVSHNPAP